VKYLVRFLLVWSWAFAGVAPGLAQADKRVALLIGNSAYQHTRALPNPKSDAEALAKLLQEKGFLVTLNSDLDYRGMREAVRAFSQVARDADVALVYYAGHGLEVGGQNYLLPTDAKVERGADLEYEAVMLSSVLSAAGNARRLRVVILDACRNNPLGERMVLASGVTRAVARGLARIDPQGGVLVAYAAKEGTVAQDGTGRHSPYAQALLKHIATPGLDVQLMFRKVRDDVLAATRNEQEPFTYGSLGSDIAALVPGPSLSKAQEVELAFWNSVKDSTTPTVLRTYLERYPNGEFAPIARVLTEHYERQQTAELAAREEARKREEEERIAAAVKRIEEERRAREAALAGERRRAEEAKNSAEAKLVDDKQRAEWLARTEDLKKALEEVRLAREAAAAAEKQRLEAVKAAEEATKAAERAIAAKREADKTGDPTKLAALPNLANPANPFDGNWLLHRVGSCKRGADVRFKIHVSNGVVRGRWGGGPISGTVSSSGQLTFKHASSDGSGKDLRYAGSLKGDSGSGTFDYRGTRCRGTFTLLRS
jgi:Caspase domain